MSRTILVRAALVCIAAAVITACASSGPDRSLEESDLIFTQFGKPLPSRKLNGVTVLSMANRRFSITAPLSAPKLQLCASHRPELFDQLNQQVMRCFQPGTGMAPGREESVYGWVIRLNSEGAGHNYFDASRLLVGAGRKSVEAVAFDTHDSEAAKARNVYLLAFIDFDEDGRAAPGEVRPYIVELDEPIGLSEEAHIRRVLDDFSRAVATIQEKYVDQVVVTELIESAIDGLYAEGGIERPADRGTPLPDAAFTSHAQRVVDAFRDVKKRGEIRDGVRLWRAAIGRMAADLDPMSAYLQPLEFARLQYGEATTAAIGVGVRRRANRIEIAYVIPGSPAARSDLQRGDQVVEIQGRSVAGASAKEVVDMLRGRAGTTVTMRIRREASVEIFTFSRQPVKAPQLECRILDDRMVYLRPYEFGAGYIEALREQIRRLQEELSTSPGRLVLDLRGHGGGLFNSAVFTADVFLESGLISATHGRGQDGIWNMMASVNGLDVSWPLMVLVDEDTASGAEVIAAALQDHRRATIIGTPTRGHGVVQTIFPLLEGGLKLTTGRLKRPSGKPLDDGVTPDILIAAAPSALKQNLKDRTCPGATPHLYPVSEDATLMYALTLDRPPGGINRAGPTQPFESSLSDTQEPLLKEP